MRLLDQGAEIQLFDKVKSISAQHQSWRSIHIDFATHKENYSDGLRTHVVTSIIKELLEDENGYIYLFEDGDVVILFQGKLSEIVNKLGQYFRGLGDLKRPEHADEALYKTYDLSIQWEQFYALCEAKAQNGPAGTPAERKAPAPVQHPLRNPDTELFHAMAAKRRNRQRMSVLIVEDEPFTRRLVAGTLKGEFEVYEAGTGSEAISAYESHAPDAVFLDIELPDSNGHVILNKLASLDKNAFIVMLSGHSIKENILAALEKGAQGFVTKPFAKEKLLHYLRLCDTARHHRTYAAEGPHAGA